MTGRWVSRDLWRRIDFGRPAGAKVLRLAPALVALAVLSMACSSIPRHAAPVQMALSTNVPGFQAIRYRPLLHAEPVRAMSQVAMNGAKPPKIATARL